MYTNTVPASLRMASDSLDDLEDVRIATENRYRSATMDPELGGLGMDDNDKLVKTVNSVKEGLIEQEHQLILELQREVRKTPFITWIKAQPGIGEKQAARLLSALGDPYLMETKEGLTPRTLRQLWAYSGYAVDGASARRPKKGMTQEEVFAMGNPEIKMRAFLMATSCVKSNGHYRDIYDAARIRYEEEVHSTECKRCGPSGKPAQPGSSLSSGHQHARALRAVAKEILRDLWLTAKDFHESD